MITEEEMLGKIIKEAKFIPIKGEGGLILKEKYVNVIASSVLLRSYINDVVLSEYIKSPKYYGRLRKYMIRNINAINKLLNNVNIKISSKDVKALVYLREIMIYMYDKKKIKILCQKLKNLKLIYNVNNKYKTGAYSFIMMEQDFNIINKEMHDGMDVLLTLINNIKLRTIKEEPIYE